MFVTVSAVIMFAALTVMLVRGKRASMGAAAVVFVFGFLMADTGMAPSIHNGLYGLANVVHSLRM